MKVLMIGAEPVDHAIAFANGVAANGPLTLVLPQSHFGHLTDSLSADIDLHLMDWPRHRSLANIAFLWRLTRLIRHEAPDVIHLLSNTTLWLNLALPFWRPIPLLTTIHDAHLHPGDSETGRLPRWSPALIVRQSGDVVVHGQTLRSQAAAAFQKALAHIHILPHPAMPRYADLARSLGLRRREDKSFRILLFGRIFAYKGLDLLIRAEDQIGDALPDLSVVIAGRGDDPNDFLDLTHRPERYDIRHRYIPDAEVSQLFLDADLVVLPYREASQSGVLPVAATFGLPVIVTDVGELGATVEPQGMGLVVDPDDHLSLAKAIVRMARDEALRRRCGARARDWAERVVSPQNVGAQAIRLYNRIVRRTPYLPPNG